MRVWSAWEIQQVSSRGERKSGLEGLEPAEFQSMTFLSPADLGGNACSVRLVKEIQRVACRCGNLLQTVNLAPPASAVRIRGYPPSFWLDMLMIKPLRA